MPTYDFKCTNEECNHQFERRVSYDDKDKQTCPECSTAAQQIWSQQAPGLGDPVRLGLMKPSDGFRDVLRNIHERTPGSQLKNNSSYI